jgi:hypothetical protein
MRENKNLAWKYKLDCSDTGLYSISGFFINVKF